MKRLLVVVLLAAGLWSAFWFWQAQALRGALDDWFEDRRADGWQAEYEDMAVRGFPNRLDIRFEALKLVDPKANVTWEAPEFEILSLSYRTGHWILVWPETQVLTSQAGRVTVESQGLMASLVTDEEGNIDRAAIEAETFNVLAPAGSVALANVVLSAQHQEQNKYHLAIASAALAAGLGGGVQPSSADGLRIDSLWTFDEIWSLDTLKGPRPQPVALDLRLAEYSDRGLDLRLAGAVTFDRLGRASGDMTVQAANWRNALENAPLPPSVVSGLEQALTVISGLNGNKKSVDLPLKLEKGKVRLGLFGVGKLPRLRLP